MYKGVHSKAFFMEPFIAKVTTDSWGFPNYGILTVSTWVFT
jgi:hypothetical protein